MRLRQVRRVKKGERVKKGRERQREGGGVDTNRETVRGER